MRIIIRTFQTNKTLTTSVQIATQVEIYSMLQNHTSLCVIPANFPSEVIQLNYILVIGVILVEINLNSERVMTPYEIQDMFNINESIYK
jgi:hypothetical protein